MSAIVRKARYGHEQGIHNSHMTSIKEVCSKDYTPEQIATWGGRSFNLEQKRNLIDNHHVWVVEYEGILRAMVFFLFPKISLKLVVFISHLRF